MTMKLIVSLAIVACIQALSADAAIDWSKIRMKYPEAKTGPHVPTWNQLRPIDPIMRRGTKDMRAAGCGVSNPPAAAEGRIVGGWEAGVHEFPWQAAVFIDDLYFCGGSLISEDWVLTAAHCAEDAVFFNIYLGAHNVRVAEDFRTEVIATDYYIHPGWNSFSLRNDIALIKLSAPIAFSDIIKPICLPPMTLDPAPGSILQLSGWGRPSDAVSSISPVLRKTNVTTMSNADCDAIYSIIYPGIICITTANDGHGSCNGDSGGPMSVVDEAGIFTQAGIVSFGSSTGCETGYPDGFSRVPYFLQWIQAITGIMV